MPSPWQIVLDNTNQRALVVYDEKSRQVELIHDDDEQYLQLRSCTPQRNQSPHQLVLGGVRKSESPPRRHSETYCVTCGSKLQNTGFRKARRHEDDYVDGNYFQLLASEIDPKVEEKASKSAYSSISENAFLQGYFDKFFELKHELGRGGRGTVWLVEHVLNSVSLGLFACKKVPVGDDTAWLNRALYEVTLLKQLNHPNLIRYNHVWLETSQWSPFGPAVPCAYILQEYCSGGNLEMYVREKEKLSLAEVISFITDILRGVAYLHDHQIIHRDLKPSNFLLKERLETPQVLVSDFGEGDMEGKHRKSTGTTGTLEYCAPELLTRDVRGNLGEFSRHSDMFSIGLVLYFLCFSHTPYRSPRGVDSGAVNFESLREEICTFRGYDGGDGPTELPQELVTLLTSLLSVNPEERVSARDALFVVESIAERPPSPSRRLSIRHPGFEGEDEEESVNEEILDFEHGSGSEVMLPMRKIVPEQSIRQIIPPSHLQSFRRLIYKAEKVPVVWYGIKAILLAIKVSSIQTSNLSPAMTQFMTLLVGIELPLGLMASLVMFVVHITLLGVCSFLYPEAAGHVIS